MPRPGVHIKSSRAPGTDPLALVSHAAHPTRRTADPGRTPLDFTAAILFPPAVLACPGPENQSKQQPDVPAGSAQVGSGRGQGRQISALDRTGVGCHRDNHPARLEGPEHPRNKKPTATRKKKAVAWKGSRRATSDRKVASPAPAKPRKLRRNPRKRIELPPRPVFPLPLKPEPPGPEILLSPEELRRKHLEEMLSLVQAWFAERRRDYWRAEAVLDKARKLLAASPNIYVRGLPEAPMSAAQLYTRPPEMDAAIPRGTYRTEELCALWLAAWAHEDRQLRKEVLDKVELL